MDPLEVVGLEGQPAKLSNKSTGFRDVWWCHVRNEPFIIEYRGEAPHCVECGHEPYAEMHTFIAHIHKPIGR